MTRYAGSQLEVFLVYLRVYVRKCGHHYAACD